MNIVHVSHVFNTALYSLLWYSSFAWCVTSLCYTKTIQNKKKERKNEKKNINKIEY